MAYSHRYWLCFVNQNDSTFVQDYATSQEIVLEFEFEHVEGDFATLEATIKNPRTPLLAPGKKRWVWLSYDDGPATTAVPMFFGQCVAIPGGLVGERIKYSFVARPAEVNAMKAALADTLRTRPWWDKALIDKNSWEDDDLVLEARAATWYYDPIDHDVDTSHFLIGEEGVVEFLSGEHIEDALDCTLGTPPVHTCEISATISWTQQGTGVLDLTEYIRSNWPNEDDYYPYITSFSLKADDWPTAGAAMKDGWTVAFAEAISLTDLTVRTRSGSGTFEMANEIGTAFGTDHYTGITVNYSYSEQYIGYQTGNPQYPLSQQGVPGRIPEGSVTLPQVRTQFDHTVTYQGPDECGITEVTGISINVGWAKLFLPMHHTLVTLRAGYEAQRPFEETVKIVLSADIQPIITAPDQSQIDKIDNISSVNLSEELDPENYEGVVIHDKRARSFVTTYRGREMLEHLILLARAKIISNSRAMRVKFRPIDLDKMQTVTLQHNCLVHCDKLPTSDGQALGKVLQRSISFSDGQLVMVLEMGCCPGRGGTAVEVLGEPAYVDDEYIDASEDWQEYVGSYHVVGDESDVSYSPPLYDPQDDGLDLIAGFTAEQAIDTPLAVENPPAVQRVVRSNMPAIHAHPIGISDEQVNRLLALSIEATELHMESCPTKMSFALKSMKASFKSHYDIQTTQMKLPKMIDLES